MASGARSSTAGSKTAAVLLLLVLGMLMNAARSFVPPESALNHPLTGTTLVHEIEAASLPVYVVFFALAGATLRLDLLAIVAVPAALLIAARALGIWTSSSRRRK